MHKNLLQLVMSHCPPVWYLRVGLSGIIVTIVVPLSSLDGSIWTMWCINKAVNCTSTEVLGVETHLEINILLVILVCLHVWSGRLLCLLAECWQFLVKRRSRNAKQFDGNWGCELSFVHQVKCSLNQWVVDVFAAWLRLCCRPADWLHWFLNWCSRLLHLFLTLHSHHVHMYRVGQKKPAHYTLVHIFAKYWPIFIILSLKYSVENLQ